MPAPSDLVVGLERTGTDCWLQLLSSSCAPTQSCAGPLHLDLTLSAVHWMASRPSLQIKREEMPGQIPPSPLPPDYYPGPGHPCPPLTSPVPFWASTILPVNSLASNIRSMLGCGELLSTWQLLYRPQPASCSIPMNLQRGPAREVPPSSLAVLSSPGKAPLPTG